jgi:hypothetical protein
MPLVIPERQRMDGRRMMPRTPDTAGDRSDPRPDPAERGRTAAPSSRGMADAVRRLERRIGTYRPGRSPWVWVIGPGINLVVTTAGVCWVGIANGLGWVTTLPLALFCGISMGAMAGLFLGTSWEQEEDERRAAEALAGGADAPPATERSEPDVSGGGRPRRRRTAA